MKKQVIILMLVACMSAGQLSAQEPNTVSTLPTITVTSGTVVNKEISKAFKKTFPNAQNLKWYELDKMYMIKFIENDMRHQALFTKKGYMKYDISFGSEKHLSYDMLKKIQTTYDEYNITRVANVKEAGRDIWVINLENPRHFLLVRFEEDQMEEVEKYNKN